MSGEERAAEHSRAARAPQGSWARAYSLVLAALVVDILLLWWLTERYR